MHPESSPFSPGRPAPLEIFLGRKAEIEILHGMAKASTAPRLQVGFAAGERSIGGAGRHL